MPNDRRTRGASHDLLLVIGTIAFGIGLSSVAAGLHPLDDAGAPRASEVTSGEHEDRPRASEMTNCACGDSDALAGWHRSLGHRASVQLHGLRGEGTATPVPADVQRSHRGSGPVDSSRSDPIRPGLGDKRRILTALARAARNRGLDSDACHDPRPATQSGACN